MITAWHPEPSLTTLSLSAGQLVVNHSRDPGPQQDHSILSSHASAGLMVAGHGRGTGPQPNNSILQCHGSAGLMVAYCGRDTYSGVLRKGDNMCC